MSSALWIHIRVSRFIKSVLITLAYRHVHQKFLRIFLEIRFSLLMDDLWYISSVTYRMGVGPPSWMLCTELVSQKHRSLVQSLCYALNAIFTVITSFCILPLYNTIGCYAFLILYAFPSATSLIYLYKNLPETQNREIYAIVRDLKTNCGS